MLLQGRTSETVRESDRSDMGQSYTLAPVAAEKVSWYG